MRGGAQVKGYGQGWDYGNLGARRENAPGDSTPSGGGAASADSGGAADTEAAAASSTPPINHTPRIRFLSPRALQLDKPRATNFPYAYYHAFSTVPARVSNKALSIHPGGYSGSAFGGLNEAMAKSPRGARDEGTRGLALQPRAGPEHPAPDAWCGVRACV